MKCIQPFTIHTGTITCLVAHVTISHRQDINCVSTPHSYFRDLPSYNRHYREISLLFLGLTCYNLHFEGISLSLDLPYNLICTSGEVLSYFWDILVINCCTLKPFHFYFRNLPVLICAQSCEKISNYI